MSNLLNTPVDFKVTRTPFGTWKRYLYQSGALYREFTSHARVGAWPLVRVTGGRNPETGEIPTALGVIAIGRKAVGVVAVGQLAVGVIAVGQLACGVLALGQLAIGLLAGAGQAACGIVAMGQFAAGFISVGQFGLGAWTLAQHGFGQDLGELLRSLFDF